tara:strand:+ start:201 stop:362 length:162 start_codon:yes stop_codon:yes gene_type:complete
VVEVVLVEVVVKMQVLVDQVVVELEKWLLVAHKDKVVQVIHLLFPLLKEIMVE